MTRAPTLVTVFVVLLVLFLSALHILQQWTTLLTRFQSSLLEIDSSSYNSSNESSKKDKDERNQQCISLLKKYSGEPFWDTLVVGRDKKYRNVEVFPHDLNDPIIIMSNQTQATNRTDKNEVVVQTTPTLPHDIAFCTIAKNGCSRWRRFIRRVMGYEDYLSFFPHHATTNGLQYSKDFSLDLFHRLPTMSIEHFFLNNTKESDKDSDDSQRLLLRIAIVRDPLTRTLSAWKEKVTRNPEFAPNCPSHLNVTGKFEDYITCLYGLQTVTEQDHLSSQCDWNNHYNPQSCHCHLTKMKYDMLLPAEKLDEWIDPLLSCLGLEKYAQNFTVDGDGRPVHFTSKEGKRLGSKSTGSSDIRKLCFMYNKTVVGKDGSTKLLYDMAREIYKIDKYFSFWNMSDCLLLHE